MATSLPSFLKEYIFLSWKHNRMQCDQQIYVRHQFFCVSCVLAQVPTTPFPYGMRVQATFPWKGPKVHS